MGGAKGSASPERPWSFWAESATAGFVHVAVHKRLVSAAPTSVRVRPRDAPVNGCLNQRKATCLHRFANPCPMPPKPPFPLPG
jgi:hypothetical protein